MAKRKTVRKTRTTKAKKIGAKPITPSQEALQITWLLKGKLKSGQIYYLRIGELLSQVRDRKLYADLHHASMEEYAFKRLQLRQASMYRYLQVYDWVRQSHPEWLKPKPKGFIPDLSDVSDLMWIEKKLTDKNLSKQSRLELETMRAAALQGTLRESDLNDWQQRGRRSEDGVRSFLSTVRAVRKRGSRLDKIPADAIAHLDAAIEIIRATLPSTQQNE